MLPEKPHLLVIDDNEDILYMLQAMLRHKGYRVSIKENTDGIEAAVAQTAPDIILMDMLLSGADGRQVCREFKLNALLSAIPVIMLSAHPQARVDCLEAGADYFVEKPFEMSELLQVVAQAEAALSKNSGKLSS